ncbi:MAG: Exodeoxyribonuclease [Pseudomonadales bacterium]|nr:Exodeoxyribonuclease [Pseudomonadales bacterium]
MRVISFCADGVREAASRGFYDWVLDQDADIICMQDLRAAESALGGARFNPEGYFAYFFDAIDASTNGVAIYCRKMPKAIMTGLGLGDADGEGRYMQADFENISVASLLAPVASMDDPGSLARKSRFFEQLRIQLDKVRKKRRQYILCGNWNMAHAVRDVQQAERHAGRPGFLDAERQWLDALYGELGYTDAFRLVNQDDDEFSWWPSGRDAGDGWRVDLQVVSPGVRPTIEYGAIYKGQEFSSHAPLIMDYDIEPERL